jgi:hypothetical protein
MAKKAKCPTDLSHNTFVAKANVNMDWMVDEDGSYLDECCTLRDVVRYPSMDDEWTCRTCNAYAVFEEEGDPNDPSIISISWQESVIMSSIEACGIYPSREMMHRLMRDCKEKIEESIIEAGNSAIDAIIRLRLAEIAKGE